MKFKESGCRQTKGDRVKPIQVNRGGNRKWLGEWWDRRDKGPEDGGTIGGLRGIAAKIIFSGIHANLKIGVGKSVVDVY